MWCENNNSDKGLIALMSHIFLTSLNVAAYIFCDTREKKKREIFRIQVTNNPREFNLPSKVFDRHPQPKCHTSTPAHKHKSLVCDKSVTTKTMEFFSFCYRKKRLQTHFLTGIVSLRSLQNLPLESRCVVVALIENYSTSKPLKSSEKSQILSCDTLVANERNV